MAREKMPQLDVNRAKYELDSGPQFAIARAQGSRV
jgi:hypothetical protein